MAETDPVSATTSSSSAWGIRTAAFRIQDRGRFDRLPPSSERAGRCLIATDSELVVTLEPSSNGAKLTINGATRRVRRSRAAIHRRRAVTARTSCRIDVRRVIGRFIGSSTASRRVATNSPSYITGSTVGRRTSDSPLATFPPECLAARDSEFHCRETPISRSAAKDRTNDNDQPYRFLVMADHSIFINQMLLEPGTDNLELAYRRDRVISRARTTAKAMRLLRERPSSSTTSTISGRRSRNRTRCRLPQVNLWAMQDKLTDLGNAIIDRLQTNNAHNSLILGSNPNQSLSVIARFFLILANRGVPVSSCVRRLWRTRKPTDIPPPPNGCRRLDRTAGRLRSATEGTPPPQQRVSSRSAISCASSSDIDRHPRRTGRSMPKARDLGRCAEARFASRRDQGFLENRLRPAAGH